MFESLKGCHEKNRVDMIELLNIDKLGFGVNYKFGDPKRMTFTYLSYLFFW